MIFRNLNVFIACFAIAAAVAAGPLYLIVGLVLGSIFKAGGSGAYGFSIAYVLIAAVLAIFWWRVGLSPASIKPGRKRRFGWGHVVLALTNVLALGGIILPMILAKITGDSQMMHLAWFALPVYALGFFAWPAGLFMVWSSRA